jgi:hypothetical protein
MTTKKLVPIKYTARDFNSIKSELVEYAKKYYPDTYKDFNEASFGSLMLESVSYIGDVLSFYTDYSSNESHLKTAIEYNNILKHGYKLGYRHNPFPSSYGTVALYCIVPANPTGYGPNLSYAPILKKGTSFSAGSNTFTLIDEVNMNNPRFSVRIAKSNPTTGEPTYYAIKGFGTVISGIYKTQNVSIGSFRRFRKIQINEANVADIVSVVDSEGNEYYEADYLSQNISYREIPNTSEDSSTAPSILIPFAIPRRFVVERDRDATYLVFGASDMIDVQNDEMLEDPTKFVLEMYGRKYVSDTSFDPKRLINSDKFGIAPSNTTLKIVYRVNTLENVNAAVGTVNNVSSLVTEFQNEQQLNALDVEDVRASIIVENEDPIVGYIRVPDSEELKIRILNNFASQNRAVTEKDYEALSYSMPGKFGSIKRVKIVKDQNSFKRNLNLYVISEDENGHLINSSINIKKNLKTWLDKNKVLSDTIDIIDAKIVNLSVDFTAIGIPGKSKTDVLEESLAALREYFTRIPEIGEPFMINNVLSVLKRVESVLDVKSVTIKTKTGSSYARTNLMINTSTNTNLYDSMVKMPLNAIWEIKFPNSDIRGTIV